MSSNNGPSGGQHARMYFWTDGSISHEKACRCEMPMDRIDQMGASAPEQSVPTTRRLPSGQSGTATPKRRLNQADLHADTHRNKAGPQESNFLCNDCGISPTTSCPGGLLDAETLCPARLLAPCPMGSNEALRLARPAAPTLLPHRRGAPGAATLGLFIATAGGLGEKPALGLSAGMANDSHARRLAARSSC